MVCNCTLSFIKYTAAGGPGIHKQWCFVFWLWKQPLKQRQLHNKGSSGWVLSSLIYSTWHLFLNQPDALIIPILFCYKTVYVSGISAHHQFSTVHLALIVSCRFLADDRFQAESGLLGSGHQQETCMKFTNAECTVENYWWWAEKMPETCTFL